MKNSKNSLYRHIIVIFTLFMAGILGALSVLTVLESVNVASSIYAREGAAITEKVRGEFIDLRKFETLLRAAPAAGPALTGLQDKMFDLLRGTNALFLYIIAPPDGEIESAQWRYVADGSDVAGGANYSAPGQPADVAGYDRAFAEALAAKATRTGKLTYDRDAGQYLFTTYTPVLNAEGAVNAVIGCDFSAGELIALVKKQILKQSAFALAALAFGTGMMIFFMRLIFPRLAQVTGILKIISEGDGDLTTRITVNKQDEIGTMAAYFNQTLDKIRRMIALAKDQSGRLFKTANDLERSMTQTAAAIHQISANIQSIKMQIVSQSAGVAQTGATMEQVLRNIDKLNDHIETQTQDVAQSSSSIEQMLANIEAVTQTLTQNAGNTRELIAASDEGRSGLREVAANIEEIARESAGLLEINSVMHVIASQTNLLSMNAAIEAAHAGESGKGFAVVADEIRKLAENSSEQSKIISGVLKTIKDSIDKMGRSTEAVMNKFQAIDDMVKLVSAQEETILSAMEEQGEGSKHIVEAVCRLNDITQLVRQGAREMSDGSKEVIEESKNLEKVTAEISNGMNEMAAGSGQINAAAHEVNEISRKNMEDINALAGEMAKFKVE